jgi:hypothetical protein
MVSQVWRWRMGCGGRPADYGEIKEALRTTANPLTWLGFVRVRRSARVPLAQEGRDNSSIIPALTLFKRFNGCTDERPR